jgi:hypothetical protein
MTWKFWKRSKKETVNNTLEIPLTALARWYFYDAGLEEPNVLSESVGMVPVSEEGNALEEEASDIRLSRVIPLVPFIETISDINAQSIANLQFDHYIASGQAEAGDLEKERIHIEDMYRQVSYSALLSAFASALELGIISTTAVRGELYEH